MAAIEDLTYEFLQMAIGAATEGDILFGLELHDTVYKKIETTAGVRIGDGDSEVSVDGQDEPKEYNGRLTLVFFALIEKASRTERAAARTKVFDISMAVAKLFLDDPKMGGEVCGARPLRCYRGFDRIEGKPYAVANMDMVFNERN